MNNKSLQQVIKYIYILVHYYKHENSHIYHCHVNTITRSLNNNVLFSFFLGKELSPLLLITPNEYLKKLQTCTMHFMKNKYI